MLKSEPKLNWENKEFLIKLSLLSLFIVWLFFLYKISSILIIFFIALFLNILFSSFLNKLNKLKVRDSVWIFLIFFIILIFLFITVFAILPIFVNQLILLLNFLDNYITNYINIYKIQWIDGFSLPIFMKNMLKTLDINQIFQFLQSNIWEISSFLTTNLKSFLTNWSWIVFSITNTLFNIALVFVFSFFIALERKGIRNFFYKIIPQSYSTYILSKEEEIIKTLNSWLKSQLILWVAIFFITLLWLVLIKLFGIEITNIFTLSLIAGMMEFVPYVWPFLALIPAVAIALGISFKAVIVIVVLYIIIQQVENNILVPYVMGKNLSLSPFSVLLWMMVWGSILWIMWIIIAVPLVAIIQIFLQDYLNKKKNIK